MVSLYQEANWRDPATGHAPSAGTIAPRVDVNRSLHIRTGTPGGGAGAGGTLQMGTGGLLVSHASLRMRESNQSGIDMGAGDTSFQIIDGIVLTEFVRGGVVTMSGRSELTLYGSDDPLENTTIELQSPDCYVYLPGVLPSRVYDPDFKARFSVNGPRTNGSLRITQYYI